MTSSTPLTMRYMGFCGVDDSVSPEILGILSEKFHWIEWGVLFRPDLAGSPRYASQEWVNNLSSVYKKSNHMNLAGHLCAERCQQILSGDFSFVETLFELGFRRVQVNATAANAVTVDPLHINKYVSNIKQCMEMVAGMEWIIQCNEETRPIWEQLVENPAANMSILYDASCGKGVRIANFPSPLTYPTIPCGYAGGIGPNSINEILTSLASTIDLANAVGSTNSHLDKIWIDMESSLRMLVFIGNDRETDQGSSSMFDSFSIDKCMSCILAGVKQGLPTTAEVA